MAMTHIVNLSVNETLPRTVMTSVTILLALGALLIWGGHVLRGFTAVMILGVIVGTYSSIYVSSSLLITLGLRAEPPADRSEEHTSELQSLMRISYAVFCLKKKKPYYTMTTKQR